MDNISLGWALLSGEWTGQVEAIRAETDPEKRKALKAALPCIMPGGLFRGLAEKDLKTASGYLCADLDYKPEMGINADLEGFDIKTAVARLPYVAYCGKSCGGNGYFLIVKIADPEKYKDYYRALCADFKKGGLILDTACSNISSKRFVSWDDNPYINTRPTPYDYMLPERGTATDIKPTGVSADEETRKKVENVIAYCETNGIDITSVYDDWVKILAALAHTFGPSGEIYAFRISHMYPDYSETETRAKYKSLLQQRENQVEIGTFFYIAQTKLNSLDIDFAEIPSGDNIQTTQN